MAHASSRLSSMFSRLQKDFCFFCSSRRTHLGQGTDFSLHSEWKTAPQLSHLLQVCKGVQVDLLKEVFPGENPAAQILGHGCPAAEQIGSE